MPFYKCGEQVGTAPTLLGQYSGTQNITIPEGKTADDFIVEAVSFGGNSATGSSSSTYKVYGGSLYTAQSLSKTVSGTTLTIKPALYGGNASINGSARCSTASTATYKVWMV